MFKSLASSSIYARGCLGPKMPYKIRKFFALSRNLYGDNDIGESAVQCIAAKRVKATRYDSRTHSPLRQRSGMPSPRPLYFFALHFDCVFPPHIHRFICIQPEPAPRAGVMSVTSLTSAVTLALHRDLPDEGRHRMAPAALQYAAGAFSDFWEMIAAGNLL